MAFVIDASAMLAFLYREVSQDRIDALAARLLSEAASVPAVFPYEIFNSFEMARRRGRVDGARIVRFAGYMSGLALDVRPTPDILGGAELRRLAEQHGLTVYDASYLALAQYEGLDLISSDKALLRAAQAAGVMATAP